MISAIIPTRWVGSFDNLKRLVDSLQTQTIAAQEILIIIDFDVSPKLLKEFFVTDRYPSVKILCQEWYGVSSARNRWATKSQWGYCLFCDDDIFFQQPTIVEQLLDRYGDTTRWKDADSIIYPTILYHDTGRIQTQWFVWYNRLMCRPIPKYALERKSKLRQWFIRSVMSIFQKTTTGRSLKLIGSICFLTSKKLLEKYPFDRRFTFIYEDLERSYRIWKWWVVITNPEDIEIEHRERPKNILAQSYVDTSNNLYLKTKHRIRFVLIHANWRQKICFYCCWFWVSNIRTFGMILLFGGRWSLHPWKKIRSLIAVRWRWIVDGLNYHW